MRYEIYDCEDGLYDDSDDETTAKNRTIRANQNSALVYGPFRLIDTVEGKDITPKS